MELTAATVAVRVDTMLRRELEIPIDGSIFWTDSTTVLQYIKSESARFHTFVANRVQLIREASTPSQWGYIPTTENPADECSRGLTVKKFLNNSRWTRGPDFLWQRESEWPTQPNNQGNDQLRDDPEVKTLVNAIQVEEDNDIIDRLLRHYSKWHSLKKAVGYILKLKKLLLQRVRDRCGTATKDMSGNSSQTIQRLSVYDLKDAEEAIICYIQRHAYAKEMEALRNNSPLTKSSSIFRLNPVLENGMLEVGGRLHSADIPLTAKHPIIVPKTSVVADLILQEIHELSGHSGRNQMLATLQQQYWVVGANAAARKITNKCVICRRQRAKVMEQKMASLPADRITADEPPFSRVGMDFFGPLEVKVGRSRVKRYGVVFICLALKWLTP